MDENFKYRFYTGTLLFIMRKESSQIGWVIAQLEIQPMKTN